ncbi:amino acid ABC transporter permease [Desulfobacter hydrogenophilus]|uniref:Amino acid ABC transporter permease n=1 Tax=Desulfobacter hydrogenophilus TaxID=2291 RepID=A0A328FJI0_9BACT|nr:amino acid ABC transporter permease [Desulfobacter hydrogenophilus]NDY70819.1 amino acid ABC transporter permease [Desulfobacter hydrogenophilus]QBH11590.1 amino acid ABC transporter permease [Desulfobacter hydrogenophilus]RAM03137.1 amino acid ABC transporter permease [Desulfobacter hydrogenophilus]
MKNSILEEKVPFWLDPDKRAIAYQALTVIMVGLLAWYLISNTLANLERQNIASGFGFMDKEAGFEIGESLIPYSAADSYARALVVGILNTLKVSVLGIALCLVLGVFVGISRLSDNWLVKKLAGIYIEVMQNIPILLQLFFWYALFYEALPPVKQALNPFPGMYLCNRGVIMAAPVSHPAHVYMFIAFGLGIVGALILKSWAWRRLTSSGKDFPVFWTSLGIIIGLPFLIWLLFGAPHTMDVPKLKGFNFKGGLMLSPEFIALLLGLVIYTSAFVAEIVRAGIQAIDRGQTEAAMSLGLKKSLILNLVILPQALRVIIPPLTSQMLNLLKNSSLAIAIGYPDFVSVANTTINITGQSIEGVALIMGCYLMFSLTTSLFMNWYNKKSQLVER